METQTMYKAYGRLNENGYIEKWLNTCFDADRITDTDVFREEYTGGHYHKPTTDDNGVYLYKAPNGKVIDTTDSDRADQYRPQVVTRIKAEAERTILERYPLHTQTNSERRGMLLLEKMIAGDLTADETAEREAIRTAGEWIDGIREQSNAMELEIEGMSYDELKSYEVTYG